MRPILFCAIACGWVASAQEPLPIHMLPPDAVAIAGVNVAGLRNSVLGRQLLAHMKTQNPGFTADVNEVLIAVPPQAAGNRYLFLLRGKCSAERLRGFAAAGQPAAESTWRGVRMITIENQGQPVSFACLGGELIAGGDAESLKAAVVQRAPGPEAELASQATVLRSGNDFWFVTGSRFAELAPKMPNEQTAAMLNSSALKAIHGISLGGKLTDAVNLSMRLLAATPQDAESMAGGFVMLAGMVKSDKKRAAQFAPLVDSLKVRAEGNTLLLDLSLTEAQLTALGAQIESVMEAQAPKPAAEPKPSGGVVIHSSPSDMGTVTLPPPK